MCCVGVCVYTDRLMGCTSTIPVSSASDLVQPITIPAAKAQDETKEIETVRNETTLQVVETTLKAVEAAPPQPISMQELKQELETHLQKEQQAQNTIQWNVLQIVPPPVPLSSSERPISSADQKHRRPVSPQPSSPYDISASAQQGFGTPCRARTPNTSRDPATNAHNNLMLSPSHWHTTSSHSFMTPLTSGRASVQPNEHNAFHWSSHPNAPLSF
jgi:hypothetical protein